jgi:hypothetical protein
MGKNFLKTVPGGVLVLGWLLLFTAPLFPGTQRSKYPEYKVKSLLLGSVARHIEWPRSAGLDDPAKPFIIAVIGGNPFGDYLDRDYASPPHNRRIKQRRVEIRYIEETREIEPCHLLFIARVGRAKLREILRFTVGKPILTMGDTDGYTARGIHINFYREEKEIVNPRTKEIRTAPATSMEINETALWHSGLRPRETLLVDARIVNPYLPYREKARLLEHITRFVQWPAGSSMENRSKSFNVTVIGDKTIGYHLEDICRKQPVKNKPVNVRYASTVDDIGSPHLLFITGAMRDRLPQIIAVCGKKPILTVGDSEGLAGRGVHVNFFYDGGKLRFEINQAAAQEARLHLAWHLLEAARLVKNPGKTQ